MELKHDFAYLSKIRIAMDELGDQISKGANGDNERRLADCREYFLRLTFEALESVELAKELVEIFRVLAQCSKLQSNFFSTLREMLRVKHGPVMLPRELVREPPFERRWRKIAKKLGALTILRSLGVGLQGLVFDQPRRALLVRNRVGDRMGLFVGALV